MTFPDSLDDKLLVDGLNLRTTEDYTIEAVNGAQINLAGNVTVNGDRILTPDDLVVFNIKDYGALVDGVTDDTTAVILASQAARDAGPGGVVLFPAGTTIVVNAQIYSDVHYRGVGIEASTVKLKDATNGQVFLTDGWIALTGTDTDAGPTNWSISNMTIDANGQNNPISCHGIVIYGSRFNITDVSIINHRTSAIISEWSTTTGPQHMHARLERVDTHTPYSAFGVYWNGPHDSHFSSVIVVSESGFPGVAVGQRAFYFGPKAGGTRLIHCHTWGHSEWAAEVAENSGYIWFTSCYLEGGKLGQLLIRGHGVQYHGGWVFANGTVGSVGIQLGVGGGTQVASCTIDTQIRDCPAGGLGLVNQVGNDIRVHTFTCPIPVYGTQKNVDWSSYSIQVEDVIGSDEVESLRRRLLVQTRYTALPAITARAYVGQTAPIQSWQSFFGAEFTAIQADGSILLTEQTAPAAPAANIAVLFVRDNGAGKTQLCARFPTGAIQVISTEP